MIKQLLKYGAVAGASFVAGTIYQTIHINKNYQGEKPDDKIWKGETKEISVAVDDAAKNINVITEHINGDKTLDKVFAEEDLKDVRRKLSHGISDAKESDKNEFTITLHDREHLRWIETWTSKNPYI